MILESVSAQYIFNKIKNNNNKTLWKYGDIQGSKERVKIGAIIPYQNQQKRFHQDEKEKLLPHIAN